MTSTNLSFDAWYTIAVTVAALVLMVAERLPPVLVMTGAVLFLVVEGALTPTLAVAGFSNTAVLTIAALFIVAAGLRSTGAIKWIGNLTLGRPTKLFKVQVRLIGISSVLSAVINNTPVVALLTSAVEDWCRRTRFPASKLLLPLSYATILGGMCTLIGTSTNLIVVGLAQSYPNLPTLGMLDPAWVGVPAALAGCLYLFTIGRWLLPDRRGAIDQAQNTKEYVLEMRVDNDGPLVGLNIEQANLRNLDDLFLAEIRRDDRTLSGPAPNTILQSSDHLVFVGIVDALRNLRQTPGLSHTETQVFKVAGNGGRYFVEAVVSRFSPMIGQSLRDLRFRNRYDAVVVAVNRHGRQLRQKPGDVILQTGDTLLLETASNFVHDHGQSHDFSMIHLIDEASPIKVGKAFISLGILGSMILANTLFNADIFVSALIAALVMLVSGCLPLRHARHAVDMSLIVIIACALAIGSALNSTGVAASAAHLILESSFGDPLHALIIVYGLTVFFTELVTNNAAAILMFPIGISIATQLNVHPMPFMMAVMVGASAAFITPIGYQTNLMVYGPGGYRFTDYMRVGAPLSLIVGIVALSIIPHVWHF